MTKIFSTSYCIGYEYPRNKYQISKKLYSVDFEKLKEDIDKINNFYKNKLYKINNEDLKQMYFNIADNFIEKYDIFINSKKYLSIEDKKQFDDIYSQLQLMETNINSIKNDDYVIKELAVMFNRLLQIINKKI